MNEVLCPALPDVHTQQMGQLWRPLSIHRLQGTYLPRAIHVSSTRPLLRQMMDQEI